MKETNIKVIIAEPLRHARICTIKNELSAFQEIVGVSIHPLVFTGEDNVIIVYNKEGKSYRLPLNRSLGNEKGIWEIIAGTMIVVAIDCEALEFISLTNKQAETYLDIFFDPEMYFIEGNKFKAFSFEDPFLDYETFAEFTTEGRRRKYDRLLKPNYKVFRETRPLKITSKPNFW